MLTSQRASSAQPDADGAAAAKAARGVLNRTLGMPMDTELQGRALLALGIDPGSQREETKGRAAVPPRRSTRHSLCRPC